MSNFQIALTGIFVACILFGVVAFSMYTAKTSSVGNVTIWGTLDSGVMTTLVAKLNETDKSFQGVSYVQRPAGTFMVDVINAMAAGTGPDVVLVSQDQLHAFSGKLLTIPYSVVSQSDYISSFVNEGRLFLNTEGTIAMPFVINPMVMYWNRDLVAAAGLPTPPKYWDELLTQTNKMTTFDTGRTIKRSAIAMGSWDNVAYAKQILSTLFMQAGDPITSYGQNGMLTSVFGLSTPNSGENPASSALRFYTEFANPSKVTYSWNRSLPKSTDAFVAGNTALYLGFAGDYAGLRARNPNLSIGVAMVPQIQGNSANITFGQLTGLAITRTAANPNGALVIAQKLSDQTGATEAAFAFGLPSVRLDAHIDNSADASQTIFYQSALIARGWIDPDYASTDAIFKEMVDNVVSNKSLPDQAVQDASQSLGSIIK